MELTEKESAVSNFPKFGVRVSFLEKFIRWNGGRDIFEGLTTAEVCEKIVKPLTLPHQCSYCDLMITMKSSNVGPCNCFISHAWKFLFLDVVDILNFHFRNHMETIIWFDLFSNNQHRVVRKEFDWWMDTFKAAIAEIEYVLLVLSSWHSPTPLHRAWCLFELYCSADSKCKFDVALSEGEKREMLENIKWGATDTMNHIMTAVDFECSECLFPEDRDCIFEVVKTQLGYDKMNRITAAVMQNWVIASTVQAMDNATNDSDVLILQTSLGDMYSMLGRLPLALPLLRASYDSYRRSLGPDHDRTMEAMDKVVMAYSCLGRSAQAMSLLRSCAQHCRTVMGSHHPTTVRVTGRLAAILYHSGNFDEAEKLYLQCLESSRVSIEANKSSQYGCDNAASLGYLQVVADVHMGRGSIAQAKALHRSCLQSRRDILGEDHPDTLQSVYALGLVHLSLGEHAQALELLSSCLQSRCLKLGESHPDTLMTMLQLADLHRSTADLSETERLCSLCLSTMRKWKGFSYMQSSIEVANKVADIYCQQNEFTKAEPLYRWCWLKAMTSYGETHPKTLHCKHRVADVLAAQGLFDAAKALHRSCLQSRRDILGEDHPDTLQSVYALGLVHLSLGEHAQALELLSSCLQSRCLKLGESHPDTLMTMLQLADLHRSATHFTEAERLCTRCLNMSSGKLGRDHEDTLLAMLTLAKLYEEMARYEAAERLFEEYVNGTVRRYGETHPNTVRARRELEEYKHRGSQSLYDAETERQYVSQAERMADRYGELHIKALHALRLLGQYRRRYYTATHAKLGVTPEVDDKKSCLSTKSVPRRGTNARRIAPF